MPELPRLREIPLGYAETVNEAERVARHNSSDQQALKILAAHEDAAMGGLRAGSMAWAAFLAARLAE